MAGDRSRRVWPVVVAVESKGGSGCDSAGQWQEQGGCARGEQRLRKRATVTGRVVGKEEKAAMMRSYCGRRGGEEDSTEGVRLERRRRQQRCMTIAVGEEEKKRQRLWRRWPTAGSGEMGQ
ncbi:hypothetical protein B296_00026157 [Ensete ventricosum]|uniref:Uncharacterized protein n=1 Tax=Ensete ventricosum TaxID=4639 RepID=A0A426X1M0_ENSVE|nr:hypothetical protein B296_00026157 [Ensete ventricosum]